MNRKNFLSSVITAGLSLPVLPGMAAAGKKLIDEPQDPIIPPYLKAGDTIGITCPAGYIMLADIQPAIQQMESWGLKVRVGDTVGKRDFSFGGGDDDRTRDLQQMLDDPGIKAIMCARGGYGAVRLVDKLNFSRFATHPKWVIGFSDITVLHSHLSRNYGIASIHSKMCNSFPEVWEKADPVQKETIRSEERRVGKECRSRWSPDH